MGSSSRVVSTGNLYKEKFVTNYACICLATMLTLNITEIIENPSDFLGARIAAINLLQLDINKP